MLYEITISHPGLNKIRRIAGNDKWLVEEKARAQKAIWDEQWATRQDKERQRADREKLAFLISEKKRIAAERTVEAQDTLQKLEQVLARREKKAILVWSELLDESKFSEPRPTEPASPPIAPEPDPLDRQYRPKLTFFDRIIPSCRQRKIEQAHARFSSDRTYWSNEKLRLMKEHEAARAAHAAAVSAWEDRKKAFAQKQGERNAEIQRLQSEYKRKSVEAIQVYNDLLLSGSRFPDYCPNEHEVQYIVDSGILIIDYQLPAVADLPTLKQVRYITTRDTLEESHLRQSEVQNLYDSLVYQICLRVISEILENDVADAIRAAIFNGFVNFIDPSNGKESCACIMSLQASCDEFLAINLDHVDPKACFRSLKGVGSSKLYGMAAIAPVMRINREDARFISGGEVMDSVDQGTNIAAIGWEDFEFLIREIFEKEFSKNGGEVKVTRASHDGGVDAVAFDPDPIRGGKIVIQAKRYTNTVDVSAVRDLYGTVMNEGATKGILVTTASYGPDAYAFAKDKPLTLLDGGNLLYLLQQHGHRAYINLAEAKKANPQPFARTTKQ